MEFKDGDAISPLKIIGDWDGRNGTEDAAADASLIAPIIAVPTTAGTGSEVGRAGVLTNSARAALWRRASAPATQRSGCGSDQGETAKTTDNGSGHAMRSSSTGGAKAATDAGCSVPRCRFKRRGQKSCSCN